jgi:PAS domain-containing protein
MLRRVGTKLHAFPSTDRAFRAYAEEAYAELDPRERTPEALQRLVRRRYPAAVVKVQDELGRYSGTPEVWYLFRSATLPVPPGSAAPDPPWPAWADVDDDRRFVVMSPEFAAIAELPSEAMVGHRVEEFTNPADPTAREDLMGLWEEFGRTGAIAGTMRFNHADGRPREVEYRLIAAQGGPSRHRLSIRELAGTANTS